MAFFPHTRFAFDATENVINGITTLLCIEITPNTQQCVSQFGHALFHIGYHLLEKFSPVEEFIENWDQSEGNRGECERMISILS
jgi:hypothetical protein